ncbi:MAG: hypothetical protein R6U46_02545 [Marinilabilia sp.]
MDTRFSLKKISHIVPIKPGRPISSFLCDCKVSSFIGCLTDVFRIGQTYAYVVPRGLDFLGLRNNSAWISGRFMK